MEDKRNFSIHSGEFARQKTDIEHVVDALSTYPEFSELVGETEFSPEQHGEIQQGVTFGKRLFPQATADQIKEFDRTALSLVLMHYCFDGEYDAFTASQTDDRKLGRDTFDAMQDFYQTNFDTPEKKRLLEFFIIINDLGKCQRLINLLVNRGVVVADHDEALSVLFELGEVPSMQQFSTEHQDAIKNVLKYGVNVGQLVQGECVDYSFKDLACLSNFERQLMMGEAMMDIAGVTGHANQKGSVIVNEPTAHNLLLAAQTIENFGDNQEMFDVFLQKKAEMLDITATNPAIKRTITRLCLMMRLDQPHDVRTVEMYIANHADSSAGFIAELHETGYGEQPAILPYYAPATFANALDYYRRNGSSSPVNDAMEAIIPFLQKSFKDTRQRVQNKSGQGVVTMMLRDIALVASDNPDDLKNVAFTTLRL